MNSRIYHTAFYPFSLLINFLVSRKSKPAPEKHLVLVRVDAIGDYLLFRNYLKEIRDSKYADYKITLIGNSAWKSIFKEYDYLYVDKCIWLDRKKFVENPIYRYKFLIDLKNTNYEIAFQPTLSREMYFGDIIIKNILAEIKIGVESELSNIKKWQKRISDSYYQELIKPPQDLFEFYKNKNIFETFLNKKIALIKPILKLDRFNEFNAFVVSLFIGGSSKNKKYNVIHYAEVLNNLNKSFNFSIKILGSINEYDDGEKLSKMLKAVSLNLCGKTSLIEAIHEIKSSDILISNESFAGHAAVSLSIPTFIISNGNHYMRFCPYPNNLFERYGAIFPKQIEQSQLSKEELIEKFSSGSNLDINSIDSEIFFERLFKFIKKYIPKN
ncbi:glycosyltransferase family 9 protein [Candidatus Kapabacteria bacterium]|nr:glycosyltransferase family 9 protein [Candidatus Kapabacteria bacterium]